MGFDRQAKVLARRDFIAYFRGLRLAVNSGVRFFARMKCLGHYSDICPNACDPNPLLNEFRFCGLVAQSVEQRPFKPLVEGSSPSQPTISKP